MPKVVGKRSGLGSVRIDFAWPNRRLLELLRNTPRELCHLKRMGETIVEYIASVGRNDLRDFRKPLKVP